MNENFPQANDNHPERAVRTLKDLREYARHLQSQRLAVEHSFDERLAGVEGERMSEAEKKEYAHQTLALASDIADAERTIRQYLSNLRNKDVPEVRKVEDLLRFAKKRQQDFKGKIQPF